MKDVNETLVSVSEDRFALPKVALITATEAAW